MIGNLQFDKKKVEIAVDSLLKAVNATTKETFAEATINLDDNERSVTKYVIAATLCSHILDKSLEWGNEAGLAPERVIETIRLMSDQSPTPSLESIH